MKIKKYFLLLLLSLVLNSINVSAQCTQAKDSEMDKYMIKTQTQDAQGCSPCAMLALYFCSAKYCVAIEDKRKVGSMISDNKLIVQQMGEPCCCPEYLNKEPEWGSMAGAGAVNQSSGSGSSSGSGNTNINPMTGSSNQGYNSGNTNPMINNSNTGTYDQDMQDAEELINNTAALLDVLSGGSGATTFTNPYSNPMNSSYGNSYDQDVADVINNAAALGDLLTGGDGSLGGLTDYGDLGGLSSLADGLSQLGAEAEAQRAREAQQQQARAEAQARQQAAEAAARAKQQQLIASRKGLIAKFPDGKTPLSSQAAEANEAYFFTYSYDESTIESNAPVIYISNTFAVPKYPDGTWPFKSMMMENITKSVKIPGLKLSGYYMSQAQADQQQQFLANGARVYGFLIKDIYYASKKSTANSGVQTDYWGNPVKTEQEILSAQSGQIQEPVNNKPKLDYWGNPIGESVTTQKNQLSEIKETESENVAENKRLEEEIRLEIEKIKQETAQKNILEAEKKEREETEAKAAAKKRAEDEARIQYENTLKAEAESKELERKRIEAAIRAELEMKLKAEAEAKEAEQRKAEAEAKAEQEKRLKAEAELKEEERKKIESEVRAELEMELRAEAEKEAARKKIEAEVRAQLEKELRAEAEAKVRAEEKPVETIKEEIKINPSTPASGNYFKVKNKQALLKTNFRTWNSNLFSHKSNIEKLKIKKKTTTEEERYMSVYDKCSADIEIAKALADIEQTTLEAIDDLTIKINEELKDLENIRAKNKF